MRPWLTIGLMILARPQDGREILAESRELGVDPLQAALAWLIATIRGAGVSALAAVALYFCFAIDAPWLLLFCMISALAFFVSLVIHGMGYLFAVETTGIWHGLLVAVLTVVLTAGILMFDA